MKVRGGGEVGGRREGVVKTGRWGGGAGNGCKREKVVNRGGGEIEPETKLNVAGLNGK